MMVKGQGRSSEEQMEDECVQHCWGGGERARKVGGEDNGRWTGFIWCKSELKPIEERMHVKIIYTPKRIGGKTQIQLVGIFRR